MGRFLRNVTLCNIFNMDDAQIRGRKWMNILCYSWMTVTHRAIMHMCTRKAAHTHGDMWMLQYMWKRACMSQTHVETCSCTIHVKACIACHTDNEYTLLTCRQVCDDVTRRVTCVTLCYLCLPGFTIQFINFFLFMQIITLSYVK